MATFTPHWMKDDWCHICGKRENPSADISFPKNAEHDTENSRYIRICVACAEEIKQAALSQQEPTNA